MKKEIIELIEKCQKSYDKKSQRASLLIRNKKFRNELEKISAHLGEEFLKTTEGVDSLIKNWKIPDLPKSFWDRRQQWTQFCYRWHIDPDWNGKLDSLSENIASPVEIAIHPEPENALKAYISLKIDSWTTLNDIKQVWPIIEKYQKKYLSQKVEMKTNFGRDLCWYDLFKNYNLSHRQIAELWIEKYPNDESIDLIIMRRIKKDKIIMNEIKGAIEKDDELKELRGVVLEDTEFLTEIKSGRLSKKFKKVFDEERDFYISGKTDRGKLTPPLLNMIKQAIKRIDENINQMELDEKFYYRKFGESDDPFTPLTD